MSLPKLVQKQILLFSYVLLYYLRNESWLGKNKCFGLRSLAQNTPSIWKHLENRSIFAASPRIFVTAQQNGALLTVRMMGERVPWKQGQSTALFAEATMKCLYGHFFLYSFSEGSLPAALTQAGF